MDEEIRWTVRLPRRLRDALREAAASDHRSLNGQLVEVIEEYVRKRGPGHGPRTGREDRRAGQ